MHTVSRLLCRHSLLRLCHRRDLPSLSLTATPRRNESGSTLVLVTMFVIALFGFAALTIDVGRVYKEKRHEQMATDAGAFAGVAMLNTDLTDTAKAFNAIQEATYIANANGVSNTEISASDTGAIQVGNWNTNTLTFTANTTPYNAVRVPAKRTVGLTFAKVVGLGAMNPAVHSVAAIGGAGRFVGPIVPFAVTGEQLATNNY